jgi:hypothetical protein
MSSHREAPEISKDPVAAGPSMPPSRAAQFVLTGPAGGTYTVPLAPEALAAEPSVTIVTDAIGLCRVAVGRLRPEQTGRRHRW